MDSRFVGAGRFGRCYAVRKGDHSVALKVLSKTKLGENDLVRARREIILHRPLQHPNICRMLATMDTPKSVCIVLELCDASLKDHLIKHAPLELSLAQDITLGVAKGLAFIHALNVIHRDVKPHNILIKQERHLMAKLTDFGYAACGPLCTGVVGTPAYMAPEMLERVPYGYLVDVWSLGCVIHAMLDNGYSPFRDATPQATFEHIRQLKPVCNAPRLAQSILAQLLVEPGQRAELSTVIHWAKLQNQKINAM